ncbi:MAG: hypothetical protein IJ617_06270 [Oscillospiraceae bacterium]|nr:hypothetical protein [Oscillospiraceae bacterium]
MKALSKAALSILLSMAMCLSLSFTGFAGATWIDEDGDIWGIGANGAPEIIGYVSEDGELHYDNGGDTGYTGNYYLSIWDGGAYSVGDRFTVSRDTNINSAYIEWTYDANYLRHLGNGSFLVIDAPAGSNRVITISASSGTYGKSDSTTVTIRSASITASLDNNVLNLKAGATATLTATGSGGSAYNYYWSTENSGVARVTDGNSRTATVTAVSAGTTRIAVEISSNGYNSTAYCTVNVSAGSVSGVALYARSLTMNPNSTQNLAVSVTGNGASYTVAWQSSNTNIVTVAGSGENVILHSTGNAGTATVTVTVYDISNQLVFNDSCAVTVIGTAAAAPVATPTPAATPAPAATPTPVATPTPSTPAILPKVPSPTPYPSQVNLSTQYLTVNGRVVNAEIYNINGNNYFKLRDVAMMLNGTGSQFSVGYDGDRGIVTVVTGQPYTPAGGELVFDWDKSGTCAIGSNPIYVNGSVVNPWVYTLGGYNFLQLRELGDLLGFSVNYDEFTRTMIVTTK